MSKTKKISYLKLVLIFIIAGITIFFFLWYSIAFKYGKTLYYSDQYKLTKVEVDTVIIRQGKKRRTHYEVHYNHKIVTIPFSSKAILQSKEEKNNYLHFLKIITYEDWMDERSLQGKLKSNLIWIYENPYASDFYAKGEYDQLNYNTYKIKFIISVILLLISIYGFYMFLRFMVKK